MNCRDVRKFLSAFVDDELDVRTNVEIIEHVEMCRSCAAQLERLQRLNRAVAGYISSVRAPEGFLQRALESLHYGHGIAGRRFVEPFRRLAHNGWFRVALAAASIILVFGVVFRVLVAPPSAYSSKAVFAHMAVMEDRIATFYNTRDADRARKMAFLAMDSEPEVPFLDNKDFQLVGAGPEEIEFKNVGHFVFRHDSVTLSMFVFEGLDLGDVGGEGRDTQLGPTMVEGRGDYSVVAWRHGNFTYILVGRLPADDLIGLVGAHNDAR